MAASALVQALIDAEVHDRATRVLKDMGMSVSDAIRILLTRTAREGALPMELTIDEAAHDAWFRKNVEEAMADPRPPISGARAKAHFTRRRAAARAKSGQGDA